MLLGAGESGKSTIVKQMKIIHMEGYSKEELEEYAEIVRLNVVQCMRQLLEGVIRLDLTLSSEANRKLADTHFPDDLLDDEWDASKGEAIKTLWSDSTIQAVYARRSEIQLNDSTAYFLDQIDTLMAPAYLPTVSDVLRTRVITTGIVETSFNYGGLAFNLSDVGGQRNERKKWIHCFEDVSAVIFVAALSEFDQKLFEDESVNRMKEALALFEEICNSRWFRETSMILFLNKTDIFREKIKRGLTIAQCWPEYSGGVSFDAQAAYVTDRFVALNNSEMKDVYVHLTNATDTENVKFVFAYVKDIVLQNNLRLNGFM